MTELATRAGVARSTASLAWRGLVERGYAHPALRSVGGRPLRKVRCPRGGTNIRLSAFQVATLAAELEARRVTGFEIRLLLWLVRNVAEDGPGGIVGWRRSSIAEHLGVARRRITEGVRTLERAGLLRVHRGKRGRWTLTPLHAIPSMHPKPAPVLKAAFVARELAGDPRDPAAAIEAAAWAASRRARRGPGSNTQRGTGSNTLHPRGRTNSQVRPDAGPRRDAPSSRGSTEKTFICVVEDPVPQLTADEVDALPGWMAEKARRNIRVIRA